MKLLKIIALSMLTACSVLDKSPVEIEKFHNSVVESILDSNVTHEFVLYEEIFPGYSYSRSIIFIKQKKKPITTFFVVENGSKRELTDINFDVVEIMSAQLKQEKYPPVCTVIDSALSFHHNTRRLVIKNESQSFTYVKRNDEFKKNHVLLNTLQSLLFEFEKRTNR